MKRRTFLQGAAAIGATAAVGGFPSIVRASDTIKIGMLIDTSGPLQVFGQNKLRCLEVGVEEINESGGLLGRQLELIHRDTQSNNQLFSQYGRELALNEKVDVVFGCTTSSSREILRPVLNRASVPYFYNTNYEGGVCQKLTFCTSATPAQMVEPMFPSLFEEYGKKVYVLAADYNYGHISNKWAAKIASDLGGEVIGSEFFPLDASNFGTTINKIQAAKPDLVHTVFVGPAHGSFWGQWASAGMVGEIPVSSQTFGQAGEHLRMPNDVSDGVYVCSNYFEELENEANERFLKRFRAKFDDYGYIGDTSMAEYQGLLLYAEAVKRAEGTAPDALVEAFREGISVQAPSGEVSLDPATNHCALKMYLARAEGGKFSVQKTFDSIAPSNPDNQCDLLENPETNEQFEPDI